MISFKYTGCEGNNHPNLTFAEQKIPYNARLQIFTWECIEMSRSRAHFVFFFFKNHIYTFWSGQLER